MDFNSLLNIKKFSAKHNICRICLQSTENVTHLFSNFEASKVILDKIYVCFQIILSQEDYLPSVICSHCTEELNMANNFRVKCISFEERFSAFAKSMAERNVSDNENDASDNCTSLEPSENGDVKVESTSNIKCKNLNKRNGNNSNFRKFTATFVCNICNKVLKTNASLLQHNISMHNKRKHVGKITGSGINRRYICTKCPYSTPHSQTLVNHMRRHNGARPFICDCGKRFTQSSSLTAHRKTHSNITYYTCSTCGKQFKHSFTLKNHQRVHEAGTFTCTICQKVLKSQQSLQEHMHRHKNIRNYNCEDCGATFVTCSDLISHRKKHDIEKKAECHLCDYKTHAKKNLMLHLKRYYKV